MLRPNWDEYFLGLAFVISARSRDKQTKHGSVITDFNHRILGTGYNSFIEGMNDNLFPTTRPAKYDFMIHSEINCLLNCKIIPREAGGGKLYVTGQCCNLCFQQLIQCGIKEFYMAKRQGTFLEDKKTKEIFNKILKETNVKIEYLNINLNWIKELIENFSEKSLDKFTTTT